MIDFKEKTLAQLQDEYTREDLIRETNASVDWVLERITDLPDSFVTFTPIDKDAYDPYSASRDNRYEAWTLGHVVVHMTASGEEAAARSSMLARGVKIEQRLRYETPWESVSTIEELLNRLEESRKIRLAYFEAWPHEPHVDTLYDKYEKHVGKLNAIGIALMGLKHDYDHYGQIEEIIRQATVASSVNPTK